jgi:chromosome segregation ATPase
MSTATPESPAGAETPASHKRHNVWLWVSAGLALVAAGLLVWALVLRSDRNDAQAQSDAQAKAATTAAGNAKSAANDAASAFQKAYNDLKQQLGATSSDLASTEEDLKKAEQDAAAAQKQADAATSEAEKATEEINAAEAKARVVADCSKAYISAVGGLFGGGDPGAALDKVKQDVKGITAECKAALGGA